MPDAFGRLAWPMLLALAASCDAGVKPDKPVDPKPAPPVVRDAAVAVAIDATNVVVSIDAVTATPVGPFVVHYDCSHSNAPFGPGEQYRNLTYDLGAGTLATQAWETNDDPSKPSKVAPKPRLPPPPKITKLPAARVQAIAEAVVLVLRAGELKPEYPVPEGTPCTLQIDSAGAAIFTLAKAAHEEKDAASDLLKALEGT